MHVQRIPPHQQHRPDLLMLGHEGNRIRADDDLKASNLRPAATTRSPDLVQHKPAHAPPPTRTARFNASPARGGAGGGAESLWGSWGSRRRGFSSLSPFKSEI